MREADWNWKARINIDAAIAAGQPVIRGTRVPVRVILGALGGGDSVHDVCAAYNVTEEDVRAALVYAAEAVARKPSRALPRG